MAKITISAQKPLTLFAFLFSHFADWREESMNLNNFAYLCSEETKTTKQ
jgi:hypothetical protein